MARRTLVAVNTAPDSENRMHGPDARRYGFESGLVPGVDVLAYLVHDAVVEWGPGWLGAGWLDGRLLLPVYDGERVDIDTAPSEAGAETGRVLGPDGSVRAVARLASLDDELRASATGRGDLDRLGFGELTEPEDRPPVAAELLEPGTVLGTQFATFHADRADHYLDEISEDLACFRDDHLAHPGWLLRFANWALSRTVRLGPWIHVGSQLSLLGPIRDGELLEVRARVRDRFERKGHQMVDLDVGMAVDGELRVVVDHRAIWRPRQDAAPTADR